MNKAIFVKDTKALNSFQIGIDRHLVEEKIELRDERFTD